MADVEVGKREETPAEEKLKGKDVVKFFLDSYVTRVSGVRKSADGEEAKPRNTCCIPTVTLTLIMVIFAFVRRNECDAEPMIPIWIIALGITWILSKLIEFSRRRHTDNSAPVPTNEEELDKTMKSKVLSGFPISLSTFYLLLQVFLAIWFFFGCYWVFSSYSNRQYCDWYVYYGALFYLVFSCVLYIFSCCFLCCVCGFLSPK